MKTKILINIAIQYAEAGQKERAFQIFSEVFQNSLSIDNEYERAKIIGTIAINFAKLGQFTESLEIVQAIADDHFYKALALKIIAIKLAEAEQLSETLQIVSTISLQSEKASALITIAARLLKTDRKEQALRLLTEALSIAQTIQYIGSKVIILHEIVVNLIEAGQLSNALEIAQTIEHPYKKAWALVKIAEVRESLADSKQWLDIDRVVRDLQDIEDKPKADIFRCIALKLIRIRQIEQSLQILSKALNLNVEPDTKVWILITIAVEFALTKQTELALQFFSQALQIAQTIQQNNIKDQKLSSIAIWLADLGQWTDALQIVQKLSDNFEKAQTLYNIAIKLVETGREQQGSQLLQQALDIMPSIESSAKDYLLSQMASIAANAGQFSKAIELAQTIECDREKSMTLKLIATNLAKAGRFSEALELAQSDMVPEIIKRLSQARQCDRAIELTQNIADNADRASILVEIAGDLIEDGQNDRGVRLLEDAQNLTEKIA